MFSRKDYQQNLAQPDFLCTYSMYYVYLLRCKDKSLYCGITNDLAAREQAHNSGKGSKYVASRAGGKVIYSESFATKSEALQREAVIKKLSRENKEALIKSVLQ